MKYSKLNSLKKEVANQNHLNSNTAYRLSVRHDIPPGWKQKDYTVYLYYWDKNKPHTSIYIIQSLIKKIDDISWYVSLRTIRGRKVPVVVFY